MKILITSDNHLGYKETDPIQSLDSFHAFEEILQNSKDCDIMLNGGDLFHNNRPSRFTFYKTFSILRKYVLGDKHIDFTCNIPLNYSRSDINISLPVLAINGNHDDPCGFGSLSALDVLNETGLVNYVGKIQNFERIRIEPVIFKREKIIAIYFMSHVRDSRLFKLFLEKKVEFVETKADFYILIVHQNRIERTKNDFLRIDFIPEFFNLIIMGHEHDPILFEKNDQTFLQCGSTVRTSCCDAETGKKFYYKLEIAKKVIIEKIEVKSVRQFVFDTIETSSNEQITKKLIEMIQSVNRCEKCNQETFCNRCLPLIRLRIKTSSIINKFAFQNEFSKLVANSSEMLLIIKKKKIETIQKTDEVKKIKTQTFYDILSSFIQQANLKILPEYMTCEKIKEFVEKDNKNAISELTEELEKNKVKVIRNDENEFFQQLRKSYDLQYLEKNHVNEEIYNVQCPDEDKQIDIDFLDKHVLKKNLDESEKEIENDNFEMSFSHTLIRNSTISSLNNDIVEINEDEIECEIEKESKWEKTSKVNNIDKKNLFDLSNNFDCSFEMPLNKKINKNSHLSDLQNDSSSFLFEIEDKNQKKIRDAEFVNNEKIKRPKNKTKNNKLQQNKENDLFGDSFDFDTEEYAKKHNLENFVFKKEKKDQKKNSLFLIYYNEFAVFICNWHSKVNFFADSMFSYLFNF